jgi:phage terminase large subunit
MIELPTYAHALNQPRRYKVLSGGRGSAKSYTVARALLLRGIEQKRFILCGREFQNSITESVHRLLSEQIGTMGLSQFYGVTAQSILGRNGTEFIFKGMRNNINSIKSIPGITDLWLEEAQVISKASWDILIPTIREDGSEIWVTYNPENEDDPTHVMFFDGNNEPLKRDDAIIIKVNWDQNPWFPKVLEAEKNHLYQVNPDLADHVWGGNIRKNSSSQIFRHKWEVREFEPAFTKGELQEGWFGPYHGLDFGFSTDPLAVVQIYLDMNTRELLFRRAKFGYGIEIDYIGDFMRNNIPNIQNFKIRADCSRPETISHIANKGWNIEGAEKWPGSVEDGIEWLRTWNKIVIHPDCEHSVTREGITTTYGMITEAKNYSYKVDRLTQDVLTDVVDAFNHGWDAARYACQPMITQQSSILDSYS